MPYALLTITLLLLILTFLPIARIEAWPVRVLDFPRLQLSACWMGVIAADLVLLSDPLIKWGLAGIGVLALAYETWWILPYSPLYRCEVKRTRDHPRERTLAILTANVLTPNRRAPELLALVREHRPDVVVTLESDSWWEHQLDALENDYPHTIKCPLNNLYGMHVYSRLALNDATIDYLVEKDIPSMHAQVTMDSGEKVRCHFLHPAPPSPTENEESSERDAELLVVARNIAGCDEPIIITGDLNDVAWSRTTRIFRKISRLLDPRIGRGMFNTFHARYWFLRWPLDHIFHSDHFTLVAMYRLRAFGSDHFPLFTRLAYTPRQKDDQPKPQPTQGQRAFAREKVEDEGVAKDDVPEPGSS